MVSYYGHTIDEFVQGRVSCEYCHKPIYDPKKAMEHHKTKRLYHEQPCFEAAFKQSLEQRGLDTSTMPPEMMQFVRNLFGIPNKPK